MKFDSILMYISDLEVTKSFYSDLGFELKSEMESYLSFNSGKTTLQFMTQASAPELEKSSIDLNASKTFYIYIEVEDVDKIHKEIIDKGFIPSSEPKDWPWGNREFALRDPDDYILVFYTKSK